MTGRNFINIYPTDAAKHQDNFLQAHNALMAYITQCFTARSDVTPPGLRTLLEPCESIPGSEFFCAGRIWNTKTDGIKIFCPENRFPCPNKNENLTQTHFRKEAEKTGKPDYTRQHLMDLLLNARGIPDLKALDIEEKEKTEYPFRISAFVNALLRICRHMKCSQCGELFHPEFRYAKLKTASMPVTVFSCTQPDGAVKHDRHIYLNYCYHCHKIIDSRECKFQEKENKITGILTHVPKQIDAGQYLCMHCGGAQNTRPGTVCPNCDGKDKLHMKGKSRIICEQCNPPYDSAHFVSEFEKDI